MSLKKGNSVEVLIRKEHSESWFPATIVSAGRYKCVVRYDRLLDFDGNSVVEDVYNEHVRPCPPRAMGAERWTVGDTAEVFELNCWKLGKVVKVLNKDRLVVRLFGSIQLKEFQRSDLRVQQAWENNKWVLIEKRGEQILENVKLNTSEYFEGWNHVPLVRGSHKEAGMGEIGTQGDRERISTVRNLKRKDGCNFKFAPKDVSMGRVVKEKKTLVKAGQCQMLPAGTSRLQQVDVVSNPKTKRGKKCMIRSTMDVEKMKTNNLHPHSMPVCATEESNECSVASCSNNGPIEYPSRHIRSQRYFCVTSLNDAESTCASDSEGKLLPPHDEVPLEVDVHKLELHAYRMTMQALYASGPLSWEQESLLTNLRLSLHISNEEHLLHLRQLLSAQVI